MIVHGLSYLSILLLVALPSQCFDSGLTVLKSIGQCCLVVNYISHNAFCGIYLILHFGEYDMYNIKQTITHKFACLKKMEKIKHVQYKSLFPCSLHTNIKLPSCSLVFYISCISYFVNSYSSVKK